MTEENKGEQKAGEQTDYKAELEKFKTENENLKKTNEEMRLEFMGDDYLNFLEAKNKPAEKKEEKKVESDDHLNNLTPKQAYDLAKKEAENIASSKISEFKNELLNESKQKTAAEVKRFFSENPEAGKYREVMYGFATDPKYSEASLDKLLQVSKAHVKSLNEGATEEEKNRSKKSQGEKPGASSSSFQPGAKKMSSQEASEKAWEETAAKSGLF